MQIFKKIPLLILFLISLLTYSQNRENLFYAEIVSIDNSDLIETVSSIIHNNKCINKNADLFLDYRKEEYIVLGQNNIKKYIKLFKNENITIFVTFIDNNLFFIFSKNEMKLQIKKTGYKVDLTEFLDYNNYSVNELSNWILIDKNGKIEEVRKNLRGCEEK